MIRLRTDESSSTTRIVGLFMNTYLAFGKFKREYAAVRFVIPESQGTFMSCKDRSAERKSQPQTAVAVCNLILPGKEHFKDLRFILIRDTGAIIGYIYHDITVFLHTQKY